MANLPRPGGFQIGLRSTLHAIELVVVTMVVSVGAIGSLYQLAIWLAHLP